MQPLDLGSPDAVAGMSAATEGLDVGLMIYNAAYSPIGAFLDIDVEEHLKAVDVNVYGPLRLSHYFGRRFVERGKGGIILMSSMSGFQGTAMVANYAATKAYDTVLAEGLWYELHRHGVDVLACVAGATLTPSYESSTDRIPSKWARFARCNRTTSPSKHFSGSPSTSARRVGSGAIGLLTVLLSKALAAPRGHRDGQQGDRAPVSLTSGSPESSDIARPVAKRTQVVGEPDHEVSDTLFTADAVLDFVEAGG